MGDLGFPSWSANPKGWGANQLFRQIFLKTVVGVGRPHLPSAPWIRQWHESESESGQEKWEIRSVITQIFNATLFWQNEVKHFAQIPDFWTEMYFRIDFFLKRDTADVSCGNCKPCKSHYILKSNNKNSRRRPGKPNQSFEFSGEKNYELKENLVLRRPLWIPHCARLLFKKYSLVFVITKMIVFQIILFKYNYQIFLEFVSVFDVSQFRPIFL